MNFSTQDFNQNLLEKKYQAIADFSDNFSDKQFNNILILNFHRVKIKFHTDDKNFINQLKNNYPKDWQASSEGKFINIFIKSPNQYFNDLNKWEEEINPDCYEYESFIFQRDFCAKRIDDFNYFLICEQELDDGFFNFMRWLLPMKLLDENQVLVHSSAIKVKEKSYMFLGHSNAGKSTTCLNLNKKYNFDVLNDDMNIIDFSNDCLKVKPAGLGGIFPCKVEHLEQDIKLTNIYWLNQASENKIEKLSKSKMISLIIASFANLSFENMSMKTQEELLDIAQKIFECTIQGKLHLKNDASFWFEIEKDNHHILPFKGHSMEPLIKEKDEVFYTESEVYEVGDILIYLDNNGELICHRLIDDNILSGDNSSLIENIIEKNIIGKVSFIQRDNKKIELYQNKEFYLWANRLVCKWPKLRRLSLLAKKFIL